MIFTFGFKSDVTEDVQVLGGISLFSEFRLWWKYYSDTVQKLPFLTILKSIGIRVTADSLKRRRRSTSIHPPATSVKQMQQDVKWDDHFQFSDKLNKVIRPCYIGVLELFHKRANRVPIKSKAVTILRHI